MKKHFLSTVILFAIVFVIAIVLQREAQAWGTDIVVTPLQPNDSMRTPNMVSTSSKGYFMVYQTDQVENSNFLDRCVVVARSLDGGLTWQEFFKTCTAPDIPWIPVRPWIAVPEKTQDFVYVAYRKKDTEISLLKIELNNPSNWTDTTIASLPAEIGWTLHDPKIITDNHDVSSYSLYITYIKETFIDDVFTTEAVVRTSTDKGASWGTGNSFSTGNPRLCSSEEFCLYATSDIAYGHGRLYLTYTDNTTIYVTRSSDDGNTWSASVILATGVDPLEGWPQPRIAAIQDASTVMVAYGRVLFGEENIPGIRYAYSTDGGSTWQKDNQITGTAETKIRLNLALTVDPTLGSFHLAYTNDWICYTAGHCLAQSVFYATAHHTNLSAWSLPLKINDAIPTDDVAATAFLVNTPTIAVDWPTGQPGAAWGDNIGFRPILFDRKDFPVSGAPAPDIEVIDSVLPVKDHQIPFGKVPVGEVSDQTVTIKNKGNADLVIGNIAEANPLELPFSIPLDNCSGENVPPSASCSLTVRFAPVKPGPLYYSFDIPSNDPETPSIKVTVCGEGCGSESNNPPSTPELVSPLDGQTGLNTTVTFKWKKATDPDGDPLSYRLSYCTNPGFEGCSPVNVPIQVAAYAGFGFAGIAFLGMISMGRKERKGLMGLLVIVAVLTSGILLSCGSAGSSSGTHTNPPGTADEVSYEVLNLNPGTTYYWKVSADDSKGGSAESEVWSFTTE